MKKRKKSLVGWVTTKYLRKKKYAWWEIMPICTRKNFEQMINKKYFKRVRIIIEEL